MFLTHCAPFRILRQIAQSPSGYCWSPLEVEFDEATGKIGTLPEPLQKFVDGLIDQRHGKLRSELADLQAKVKSGTGDNVDRERLKALEDEVNRHRTADAERKSEYDKAIKIREEAEAKRDEERNKELEKANGELARRDGRLREMARSEIKIAAKNLGARTESLDELAALLGAQLDLDADLQPFVKGTDGKPAADKDGKPITIEGHVKAYLDSHRHHVKGQDGQGGGARGGATFEHLSGDVRTAQEQVDAADAALKKNPRDNHALLALHNAQIALDRAKAGSK